MTLVLLGTVQAVMGTLRLYNSSEQTHEKLTPAFIYGFHYVGQPQSTEKTYDVNTYFADNRDDIQAAIQAVPPDQALKINARVAQAQESVAAPQQAPVVQPPSDTFVSPVRVTASPDGSSMPGGYSATIEEVIDAWS